MPCIREIGDTCVGAKINGRLVPLRTQLQNGDQVEIVTSKAQTPSPTWERFVVTGKARARIRRFIRTQQRAQYLDLGRAIVQKAFRQEGQEFSERPLEAVLKQLQLRDRRGSLRRGRARGSPPAARSSTPPSRSRHEAKAKVVPLDRARRTGQAQRHGGADPRPHSRHGAAFRRLLPPAARRPHRRHRHDRQGRDDPHDRLRDAGELCRDAGALARRRLEQWRRTAIHVGRLNVTIANEPGNLGSLTTVIGKQGGNISNLKITNRSIGFLRDHDRHRGRGREASDEDHRRVARDAGHQLRRAGARLNAGLVMILGLGSDLIDIRRIEQAIERFGDRFLDRIFTEAERRKCERRANPARAMPAGSPPRKRPQGARHRLPHGVFWRDLGVVNLPSGQARACG